MEFATVALIALTTARLTRLITTDTILAPARSRFVHAVGPDSKLAYLAVCDWCVSVWVGTGVAVGAYHWADQPWASIVLLAASASYLTGFLAERTEG